MSDEKLKSCPFCGGEALIGQTLNGTWYAMCQHDRCVSIDDYWPTKAEAIAAWNTRATPADAERVGLTARDAWQDLVDKDDRTSPEEYPDMALITFDELKDYMDSAHPPTDRRDALEEGQRLGLQQAADHLAALSLEWRKRGVKGSSRTVNEIAKSEAETLEDAADAIRALLPQPAPTAERVKMLEEAEVTQAADAVINDVEAFFARSGGFNAYAEHARTGTTTGWSQLRSTIWLAVRKALLPQPAPAAERVKVAVEAERQKWKAVLSNPPKHDFWGAGEPDCPGDIKASNGELHTLRCKVCGEDSPRNPICMGALS